MNVLHRLHGVQFEWDSDKAEINVRKHGIGFEYACEVFFDPFVKWADAGENDEVRDAVLGTTTDGKLLFVVHVLKSETAIRLISARLATPHERKVYED